MNKMNKLKLLLVSFVVVCSCFISTTNLKAQNSHFWVDIDSADSYYSAMIGESYSFFAWNMNSNYTVADTPWAGFRSITVAFDTIIDSYNIGGPLAYSADSVKIDSIAFWGANVNYSGIDDTLICKIMSVDNSGYPSSGIYWVDTFIIASGNPLPAGVNKIFNPNIQLSTNKFCIKLEYYGSLLDTFTFVAGCPSFQGSGGCSGYTMADSSIYYPNSFGDWVWTQYNTGGVYPTPNHVDVWYDCDGINGYTYGVDGGSYIQDAWITAYVEISPFTNNCSGFNVATQSTDAMCNNCNNGWAEAIATGGTPPYTYVWSTNPVQTSLMATSLSPGSYSVCVTDSNNCSLCPTVYIGVAGTCSSHYLLYPDTTQAHTYYIYDQSYGVGQLTYDWNWGDGNHDYTANPTHTYASSGTYNICLTIHDADSCVNTYCHSYYLLKPKNNNGFTVIVLNSTGMNEYFSQDKWTVYPNPTTTVLNFEHAANSKFIPDSKLVISDLTGREIHRENIISDKFSTDVSDFSSGIYFYQILNNKGTVRGKFVKE